MIRVSWPVRVGAGDGGAGARGTAWLPRARAAPPSGTAAIAPK